MRFMIGFAVPLILAVALAAAAHAEGPGPATSLVANASGEGEILYHGQPKVVSSLTGKGQVRPRRLTES